MGATSNIIQGDIGTILYFNIADETGSTDVLNNIDTIECHIKYSSTDSANIQIKTLTRDCQVVNAPQGKCSLKLLGADIANAGTYQFQLTLNYLDGSKFNTNISNFIVGPKL